MKESPFTTVSRAASEPVNAFDDLRVIAKDGGRIDAFVRDRLNAAADELEQAQLLLISTQRALMESQAARIALNDRLIALIGSHNRQALAPLKAECGWTWTGWA